MRVSERGMCKTRSGSPFRGVSIPACGDRLTVEYGSCDRAIRVPGKITSWAAKPNS